MSCRNRKVRESLPEYLTSSLPLDWAQMIGKHLEACDECRQELYLMQLMVEEDVPEPPAGFWTSLPGRVISPVVEKRRGSHRFPFPAWAGGLTIAALIIVSIVSPWRGARVEVQIPGEYYSMVSGRLDLGLEEAMITVSGLDAADLGRSLEQDMVSSVDLLGADVFLGLWQPDLYAGLNDVSLRALEKLIDDMSPIS